MGGGRDSIAYDDERHKTDFHAVVVNVLPS